MMTDDMRILSTEVAELRNRTTAAKEVLHTVRREEEPTATYAAAWAPKRTAKSTESPYRLLVEQMQEGAATLTAGGVVIYANRSLSKLLRTPPHKLIGREVMNFVSEVAMAQFTTMLRGDLTAGVESDITLTADDGTAFPAYISMKAIDISDVASICLIVVDLTQREIALEELAKANRRLQAEIEERMQAEAQLLQIHKLKAVGQLTSGIAHDFNNLLTVVAGSLDLIRDAADGNDGVGRLAETAQLAIDRATSLTSRLLVFSRRKTLHPENVAPDRLIRDFEELIRRAAGETIAVEFAAEPGLQQCCVDPAEFQSAVLNLVINACDAMPEGGMLRIGIRNAVVNAQQAQEFGDLQPGNFLVVSIADTGTGIPPEVRDRIFEPFFTTKEVGAGSGLGLAMVWGFAKQSGGHVVVDSTVGHGTTVRLYLPSGSCAFDVKPTVAPNPNRRAQVATTGRILVVEDNADVREMTAAALSAHGFDIDVAADGVEALSLLRGDREFDLMFSDVIMPRRVNGVELAREAKRLRQGLKVLLTSGYADDSLARHRASRAEFPVLNKPYRLAELVEAISAVLNGEPWPPRRDK